MSRYIDADALIAEINEVFPHINVFNNEVASCIKARLTTMPTADVVEVRHDYGVGDFCLYGFADGNKSLAIVEIVKILDDERGVAEVKFHKVINDNTGNGFLNYLLERGKTMNASFKYLKNITPEIEGERRDDEP